MSRWSELPRYAWVGPTANQGPAMTEYRGLVLHIAQGTYAGTISWQRNPSSRVSSHFIVDTNGDIAQMVDTAVAAWTQAGGNGEWISVEFAGWSGEALTPAQLEAAARIYAYGVLEHHWPLAVTDIPTGRGLGWHGMGGTAWGGHPDCPGEPIKAQRPAILARAAQLITAPPLQEEDMPRQIPLGVYQTRNQPGGNTIVYAWIEDGTVWYADVLTTDQFPRLAARGFDTSVIYIDTLDKLGRRAGSHLQG